MKSKRINYTTKYTPKLLIRFIAIIGLFLTQGLPASANQSGEPSAPTSAQSEGPPERSANDLYDAYESKRMVGIVTAGILAPVFAGVTTMGTYLLYRNGRDDGGGFCTHITRDSDGDYRRTCKGDRGELAGIIIVSTAGGILTLAMLISGVVRISRSSRRLRRLSLNDEESALRPVQFRLALSEREVSVGFSF